MYRRALSFENYKTRIKTKLCNVQKVGMEDGLLELVGFCESGGRACSVHGLLYEDFVTPEKYFSWYISCTPASWLLNGTTAAL